MADARRWGNLDEFRQICGEHGIAVGGSGPGRTDDVAPGSLPRLVATHEINEKGVGVVGVENPEGVPPILHAHAMRAATAVWRAFPDVPNLDPLYDALSGPLMRCRLQGVVDAIVVEAYLDGLLVQDADGWVYKDRGVALPGHR